MHTAFDCSPILEWKSLPFQIESFDTWGTRLLIGTSKGQLLVYSVPHQHDASGRFKVDLQETKKGFSKKPILQLTAVEQFGVLLSLTDSYVFVHDLKLFREQGRLERTKGCSLYALDIQDRRDPLLDSHRSSDNSEKSAIELRMRLAVVVKRKILTFEWMHRDQEFREVQEFSLPDQPKVLSWAGDCLIVGMKKEYLYINETGDISEIWKNGLGPSQEPILSRLPGNEFLLSKEALSIFIGLNSKPTRQYALNFTEQPICIDLVSPYAIALTARDIEVRTVDSGTLVQKIDLPKAKFICQGAAVYIASPSNCWRLEAVPLSYQIRDLLALEEFEEALNLAKRVDEDRETKDARIAEIKKSFAFAQFSKKRFDAAMKTFSELDIEPPHVIGLFPDLLPTEIRKRYDYPMPIPHLEGAELETATEYLIRYLTKKRSDMQSADEVEETEPAALRQRAELSETIDTTLLKCYLKTNPAMVGPLLRVSNKCSVQISEQLLKEHGFFQELVMLYKNRGLHRRALELLYKHGQKPGRLQGHYETMSYLQRLGPDHLDLILEFSKWVMKVDPEDGFAIFASDDYPEISQLPQDLVLAHLQSHAPSMVVQYLEHIIMKWGNATADFHNRLLQVYLDAVVGPMQTYLASLKGSRPAPAGSEPGELGTTRNKLLAFLKTSKFYTPQRMISRFLDIDGLYEERAMLLGRIGRHDQALHIYAHKLHDPKKAEDYCKTHYDPEDKDTRDVFISLLEIYLKPPEDERVNVRAAQGVLSRHSERIDASKALELLPLNTKVADIHAFLIAVMRKRFTKRRQGQVLMNLLKAERLQAHEELLHYHAKRITIDDETLCPVCRRPMRNAAFYCYPNGTVVHQGCATSVDECPEPDSGVRTSSSNYNPGNGRFSDY